MNLKQIKRKINHQKIINNGYILIDVAKGYFSNNQIMAVLWYQSTRDNYKSWQKTYTRLGHLQTMQHF